MKTLYIEDRVGTRAYRSITGAVRIKFEEGATDREALHDAFGDSVTQESADLWVADEVTEREFGYAVRILASHKAGEWKPKPIQIIADTYDAVPDMGCLPVTKWEQIDGVTRVSMLVR